MSKSYRLVIFDWEGTIGEDTIGQVLNALDIETNKIHLGPINRQIAREYIDLGLVKAITKIFPALSAQQYEYLLAAVQQTLTACAMDVCLIAGAKTVIQQMADAGINLAIATSKGQQSLQRALQHSGLDAFFKVTRSAAQTAPKPSPLMLEEILNEFAATPQQTLMIGDSVADMEMAMAIEIDAIGVDFYHLQKAQLLAAGALHVFDDYQQVARFLQLGETL